MIVLRPNVNQLEADLW